MEKKSYAGHKARKARCLECGEKIIDYRSNKKFCCQHCRDSHHNKEKARLRHFQTMVDSRLSNNYSILDGLLKADIHSESLETIIARGFNANFVTSAIKTKTHTTFTCFDISFRISDSRVFNISRISLTLRRY